VSETVEASATAVALATEEGSAAVMVSAIAEERVTAGPA
jgi:hypothetical protein